MGDLFAPSHILFILLFILLLFGPKKLPELGNALGRTLRSFKEGAKGAKTEEETRINSATTEEQVIVDKN